MRERGACCFLLMVRVVGGVSLRVFAVSYVCLSFQYDCFKGLYRMTSILACDGAGDTKRAVTGDGNGRSQPKATTAKMD